VACAEVRMVMSLRCRLSRNDTDWHYEPRQRRAGVERLGLGEPICVSRSFASAPVGVDQLFSSSSCGMLIAPANRRHVNTFSINGAPRPAAKR
jgi:hypothetical protein